MEVKVVAWLPRGEEILAAGAASTRSGRDTYEILRNFDSSLLKFVDYAIKLKLSSVLDFPLAIITFDGVSRVFTHQLVRHRLAAYMQQSMRFVKIPIKPSRIYDPWYVIPPSLLESDALLPFLLANEEAGRRYVQLLEAGVPTEDARFVLPNGVKTHITMAADVEEWLHVLNLRTSKEAQWEIRRAMLATLFALTVIYPEIFGRIRFPKAVRAVKLVPGDVPQWVLREMYNSRPEKIAIALEEEGKFVLKANGREFVLTRDNCGVKWLDTYLYSREKVREVVKLARKVQWDGSEELVYDLTPIIGTEVSEEVEEEMGRMLGKALGEEIDRILLSHRVVVRIAPEPSQKGN